MKLTLYICDRCGTVMQMDELPKGWNEAPSYSTFRSKKHDCAACAAGMLKKYDEMDLDLTPGGPITDNEEW